MYERLFYYIGVGLGSAVATSAGLVACLAALKRFGHKIKVPMRWVFVMLWVLVTLVGFVGGEAVSNVLQRTAALLLIIGILSYFVSLPFGRKKRSK